MTWRDAEDIAIALVEQHPTWTRSPCASPICTSGSWRCRDSRTTRKTSNEGILEAIQMKWLEEHRDR